MKALLLAAGKGERMGTLTAQRPKPLLTVGEHTLLDLQIQKLAAAGLAEIIVNTAYLGAMISEHIQGSNYAVPVRISTEPYPLETAGAIAYALPLLGTAPFLLVNADVYCECDYRQLMAGRSALQGGHLVMVDTPDFKSAGDFELSQEGRINVGSALTFSGISVINPSLIRLYPQRRQAFPLKEVFHWAIANDQLTGEYYGGKWMDIGTPDRLQTLRDYLK